MNVALHRTYLDLSEAERREAAKAAKARYQGVLSSPGIVLTAEQTTHLRSRLRQLAKWVAGTLPVEGLESGV